MSLSVLIRCPQCTAEGELADAALFGQAISCPLCQHVFVAPVPDGFDSSVPTILANAPIPVSTTPIAVESMPGLPAAAVETLIPAAIAVDAPPISEASAFPITTAETVQAVIETPHVAEAVANVAAPAVAASPVEPTFGSTPVVADPVERVLAALPDAAPTAVAVPLDVATVATQTVATQMVPPVAMPVAAFPSDVPAVEAAVVALPSQPTGAELPVLIPVVATPVDGTFVATPRAATSVSGDFLVPERPPMEGPVPSFMAASPLHGPAEIAFAQSLPEPAARGSVKGPKPQSKTLQMVVAGTVSAILLFALVMFLLGDPLRGKKPKLGPVANSNSPASAGKAQDESIEDVFKRIQSSSKSDNQ